MFNFDKLPETPHPEIPLEPELLLGKRKRNNGTIQVRKANEIDDPEKKLQRMLETTNCS